MAVSLVHYQITRDLFEAGLLPVGGAILEIGEANWYVDGDPMRLITEINRIVRDPVRREQLTGRLTDLVRDRPKDFEFEIVKVFYEVFYAPSETQAVDFSGTNRAQPLDLNAPISLNRRFDVVINHGTAEHVFNIAQVFKTIHDYTVPGGLMLHECPFTGWVNHGFYTLQPTLYFDLAEANRYTIHGMVIANLSDHTTLQVRSRDEVTAWNKAGQIPYNAMLFSVLRKHETDEPFRIPCQGYYRKGIPDTGMTAWQGLQ